MIMKKKNNMIISFGEYYQNSSEAKEPVRWLVLGAAKSKMLLISEQALDCRKYNNDFPVKEWESCSLNNWLNNEFYETAFNDNEKRAILNKVFLLNQHEVKIYLKKPKKRRCIPTRFALEQSTKAIKNRWWLRYGEAKFFSECVDDDGSVIKESICVPSFVRPAIRVNRYELHNMGICFFE